MLNIFSILILDLVHVPDIFVFLLKILRRIPHERYTILDKLNTSTCSTDSFLNGWQHATHQKNCFAERQCSV